MQADLRKTDRVDLSSQPKGDLYLVVKGERYPVNSVLNISPQGIRVKLSDSMSDVNEVVLHYRHNDVNIDVNGTIAWISEESSDDGEPSYDVGISLLGPHMLFTLMQT